MTPGTIWRDANKNYWKVLDARKASGNGFAVLLKPLLKRTVEVRENGSYSRQNIEWNDDPSRRMTFTRTIDMAFWKRVA